MRISKNYTKEEFIKSADYPEVAAKITIEGVQEERLIQHCNYLLQPMSDHLCMAVYVLNGKRNGELNRLVGGHPNSDHLYIPERRSIAEDVTCENLGMMWRWLIDHRELYKLVILYEVMNCIHISGLDNSPIRGKIKVKV